MNDSDEVKMWTNSVFWIFITITLTIGVYACEDLAHQERMARIQLECGAK